MAVPQDYIQRECTVKLGLSASTTEYEVNKAVLTTRWEMVTLPPTSRDARKRQVPGAYEQTIDLDFNSMDTTDLEFLDGLFAQALLPAATPSSTPGVVYYDMVMTGSDASSTNERYTGTAYVPEIVRGGTIGSLRARSVTLAVQTFTKASA